MSKPPTDEFLEGYTVVILCDTTIPSFFTQHLGKNVLLENMKYGPYSKIAILTGKMIMDHWNLVYPIQTSLEDGNLFS